MGTPRAGRDNIRPSTGLTCAVALATVLLGACGGGDDGASVSPDDPPQTPQSSLTVTVDEQGDSADVTEWTLECEPPGGDHPDPDAACAALADLMAAERTEPADMMCTQQYFGEETATVEGTWNGAPIDREFARNDGCAEADWQALVDVFRAGETH